MFGSWVCASDKREISDKISPSYRRNIVRKSIVAEKESEKITTQRSSSAEVILGIILEISSCLRRFLAYHENIWE